MTEMVINLMGGLGLFLLGMTLMTDGLKALAGGALRDLLMRFVRGPYSGIATGAGVTALVQSSSATTLTTIGFVSAGLITFPQAIGVVLGANIGSTSTGWIVSVLGLKISLGAISPPIIFGGVLLRLLTKDRIAALGLAVTGFGLIFFGIGVLQSGMEGLAERFSFEGLSSGSLLGRLALVAIGFGMTVVMQSSSAAVAATLVALHAGTLQFEQAAAMVIGQNVGTTVTAALASIGGSAPAKRTAVAHILFNVLTGAIAFIGLPWFAGLSLWGAGFIDGEPGTTAVAMFHTLFNVSGVLLMLPLLGPFGNLVTMLTPAHGPRLTRHLDLNVAKVSAVGLQAARQSALATFKVLVEDLRERFGSPHRVSGVRPAPQEALDASREIMDFIGKLAKLPQTQAEVESELHLLHAVDHLADLAETCADPLGSWDRIDARLIEPYVEALLAGLKPIELWLISDGESVDGNEVTELAGRLAQMRRDGRADVLSRIGTGDITAESGADSIDAMIWLDRVLFHAARAVGEFKKMQNADLPVPS